MYKFLIYISHPYSIPIGKPLQAEIERRGYEVFWFSELEYTKKYFPENEKILKFEDDHRRHIQKLKGHLLPIPEFRF